jgi:phosphatidylserine/phosphatidylglycerophosphate/cardiolipin synthase-like enzyme
MKLKFYISIICLLAALACDWVPKPQPETALDQVSIQVYFSPYGGCTEAIVKALNKAKQTVLVQAYSFTSAPIAAALRDAHRRGVKVQVVLDKSQKTDKYSSATFLKNVGIPVWIDSKHAIAHNKIIIIDAVIVITGSFNFSKAAEERNAENLLIINNKQIADKYTANWETHWGHSDSY